MSQWKNDDSAANSPFYTPAQFNLIVNTDNQAALFGNTTANSFVTGAKIGVFGAGNGETQAARVSGAAHPAHTGWHIRTEGTGGRAGRVHYECLVALGGGMAGDAEDVVFPNYTLRVTSQPADSTVNASSAANVATFTVAAASTPSGATLSYFWQKWGGAAFANLAAAGAYSNVTTVTLSVLANTASDGEIYRVGVASANGATTIYSSNAILTKTT